MNGQPKKCQVGKISNKVFCVGFHKTGTSSFREACNILGYKSAHWTQHSDYGLLGSLRKGEHNKELDEFNAFSDVPIPSYYKHFDINYPGSLFVLTIRDNESWSKSVEYHLRRRDTDLSLHDEINHQRCLQEMQEDNKEYSFDAKLLGEAERIQYSHYEGSLSMTKCIDKYNQHVSEVKSYFNGKNNFLVFDVKQGWGPLCSFLKKKIPPQKFPHRMNRLKYYQAE